MSPKARVLFLPAVLSVTGCCGPDLDDLIKEHKPEIQAKIATIPAIREQVQKLPLLTQDRVTHAGPLSLALTSAGSTKTNASLSYAEDLQTIEELGYVWGRISDTGLLNECASVALRGHWPYNPSNPDGLLTRPLGLTAEPMFERCEAMTTLLVIRTTAFVQPTAAAPAGSAFVPQQHHLRASRTHDAGELRQGGPPPLRWREGLCRSARVRSRRRAL